MLRQKVGTRIACSPGEGAPVLNGICTGGVKATLAGERLGELCEMCGILRNLAVCDALSIARIKRDSGCEEAYNGWCATRGLPFGTAGRFLEQTAI
jgi:hypothetical protein